MSLATAGAGGFSGGAGAGGVALAHQANAIGQGAAPPPPQHDAPTAGGPVGPSLVGADLADKNQRLSVKQVRNTSHLPVVAMDWYSSEPVVAYCPPKPEDPSQGVMPILVGKMKNNIYLKQGEGTNKTLRKYLNGKTDFSVVQQECLTNSFDSACVCFEKPHRWLGARRLEQMPPYYYSGNAASSSSSHAIDHEASTEVGAHVENGTLDGTSAPSGDDQDRVVWKVRLCANKKALTVFPEEILQMAVHQAQHHVSSKVKEVAEEALEYPAAFALPAWSFHDAAIEAVLESCLSPAVVYPRSLCALTGALLPPVSGDSPAPLLRRILQVRKASYDEFQKDSAINRTENAVWEDEVTLVLIGMTEEGMEATAVQISNENQSNASCLFGEYKVLSNISYQSNSPIMLLKRCVTDLEKQVDVVADEADGPSGIIFYGSSKEQDALKTEWEKTKSSTEEWEKVPIFATKSDAVAMGAAVLASVSHGRSTRLKQVGNKMRPEFAVSIQSIAPVAVGVRTYYQGDNVEWSKVPVKTVFDFDRRTPAGPFATEYKAAECAVHLNNSNADKLDGEAFLKAAKEYEGTTGIPKREEAALKLRVQIVERWTRDGEWIQVGDVMKPLVDESDPDDDKTRDEAIESTTHELSLSNNGVIASNFSGERCVSIFLTTKPLVSNSFSFYDSS